MPRLDSGDPVVLNVPYSLRLRLTILQLFLVSHTNEGVHSDRNLNIIEPLFNGNRSHKKKLSSHLLHRLTSTYVSSLHKCISAPTISILLWKVRDANPDDIALSAGQTCALFGICDYAFAVRWVF